MHALRTWALLALVASPLVAQAPAPDAPPDAKAIALADAVMAGLGGHEAWNQTRYLRFDFAVEHPGAPGFSRAHTWDKWTGAYRLEGKTREGQALLVLMNVNDKRGQVWLDGQPLAGDDLKRRLDGAYGAWINDTYWLLMPYKLRDPGVNLALAGEATGEGGVVWDKLLLTFDGVGITPKDKYWVFINRETKRVDRWEYVLGGRDEPPTGWDWSGWKAYGKIQLAPDRIGKDGARIHFPVLEVLDSVPESTFAPPAS